MGACIKTERHVAVGVRLRHMFGVWMSLITPTLKEEERNICSYLLGFHPCLHSHIWHAQNNLYANVNVRKPQCKLYFTLTCGMLLVTVEACSPILIFHCLLTVFPLTFSIVLQCSVLHWLLIEMVLHRNKSAYGRGKRRSDRRKV